MNFKGVQIISVIFFFQHKIWVKPSAEQQFLYGNSVTKAGLGRITENTQKYDGVIIYSMNDIPLVSNKYNNSMMLSMFTILFLKAADP